MDPSSKVFQRPGLASVLQDCANLPTIMSKTTIALSTEDTIMLWSIYTIVFLSLFFQPCHLNFRKNENFMYIHCHLPILNLRVFQKACDSRKLWEAVETGTWFPQRRFLPQTSGTKSSRALHMNSLKFNFRERAFIILGRDMKSQNMTLLCDEIHTW